MRILTHVRVRSTNGRLKPIAGKVGDCPMNSVDLLIGERAPRVSIGHAKGEASVTGGDLVAPIEVE